MGPYHNSATGLERSAPISLSLLLWGYFHPGGSSFRRVAAFCSSPSLGKCSHLCPDIEKCRLLHWSLSLSFHFSPSYSFLAQMGTGDISGVLSKQMWLSGIPKFQSPLLTGTPIKTVYKRPTMHLPFYLACYELGRDSRFTTNTALLTRPTALFFYGAQEIAGVLS